MQIVIKKILRVPPTSLPRTTSGTRTTGWEHLG